jgi:hypothetical protein
VPRLAVLAALVGLLEGRAAADGCEEQFAAIQDRLTDAAHSLSVWRWGWGIGAVGGSAVQLGLVPLADEDQKIDLLVGAGSTLGLLVPVLFPPEINARAAAGDCPTRLADAELRLRAAAESTQGARSPWVHAGNVAFNVGVTLLLGLGWGHWTSGVVSGAIGIAVGETEILTTPLVRF